MSQEQQDTPDYVRVTLTIHEFSEDGECCTVSDKHGLFFLVWETIGWGKT